MKFIFRGVRGSIPSPGPHTARYGGNTTCIEVRTDDDTLIILDAGTGLFALAQTLRAVVQAHLFITHSHWDHIHGLPFFSPLFVAGSRVCLYGAADPASGHGVAHVMDVQLQNSYFPVSEAQMDATISYRTLTIGEAVMVGDACVRNIVMNHPACNLGYRIDCGSQSLFFTGDHEPWFNPHPPGHAEHAAAAANVAQRQAALDALLTGVDALIVDCSYTREEYPARRGWGHGHFDAAIALALRVGARTLYCTHHEPTRSDDALEAVLADVLARHAGQLQHLQVLLAREGMEVALDGERRAGT